MKTVFPDYCNANIANKLNNHWTDIEMLFYFLGLQQVHCVTKYLNATLSSLFRKINPPPSFQRAFHIYYKWPANMF